MNLPKPQGFLSTWLWTMSYRQGDEVEHECDFFGTKFNFPGCSLEKLTSKLNLWDLIQAWFLLVLKE